MTIHKNKPKILAKVIFSWSLATALFLSNSSIGLASCEYNPLTTGCVRASLTRCTDLPNLCCDSLTECSAYNLSDVCDPGKGGVPLGSCLKLSNSQPVQDVYTNPAFLVNLLVDNLFVVAGLAIFFMTLLAGFFFITGGKKGLDQAKQILLAVLVGFGIMFGAYWIVQIVQSLTGADILI